MKPKSMILLFVAGACGLIAAIATAQHLAGNQPVVPAVTAEARKSVVVALKDIPAGTELKEEMLKVVEMPAKDLPDGIYTSAAELTGQRLRLPVFKNEPVLAHKIGRAPSTLARDLGPGMKACTVPVAAEDRSMTGLINPSDHVDVLWCQIQPDLSSNSVLLILQNIKILAVGQRTDSDEVEVSGSKDSKSNLTDSYTLEVTPLQYKRVQAALGKGGKIRLALRGKGDTTIEDLDEKALDLALGLTDRPEEKADPTPPPTPEPEPDKYEVEYVRGNESSTESWNFAEELRPKTKKAKPN